MREKERVAYAALIDVRYQYRDNPERVAIIDAALDLIVSAALADSVIPATAV